jgi:hypothetical protein
MTDTPIFELRQFKEITNVAIDLDGVVYPFIPAFKKYCEERMGKELPDATKWSFYEDWGLDELTFMDWLKDAAVNHNIFNCVAPYDGVIESWKTLNELGVHTHFITTRPNYSWAQTVAWIEHYGLITDELIFTHDKQVLAPFARKGRTVLLEDHVYHYQSARWVGVYPVLQTRPWNADYPNAVRVNTFTEFVTLIKKYNDRETTWPEPPTNFPIFPKQPLSELTYSMKPRVSLTATAIPHMGNPTTISR